MASSRATTPRPRSMPSTKSLSPAISPAVLARTLAGGGLRLRLERRFGLADLGQPPLFVGNPIGQLVTTPVTAVLAILGRVLSGRLLHPARNLGGELLLGPSHPAVAHRLVLGGIRLDLGAVERDMAKLDQTSLAAQPKDL